MTYFCYNMTMQKQLKKLILRPLDILIILILFICGILLTIRGARHKGSKICINANGTHYEYSASQNGIYTVEGELGPTTFEIKNGLVRITDSPCPNKTCITQGWHNPLVCLPNKIIITVESEDELDAISE